MVGLFLRAILLGMVMYLIYMKGFTDCMFGYNEDLYKKLREWYIDKYGEDIWGR